MFFVSFFSQQLLFYVSSSLSMWPVVLRADRPGWSSAHSEAETAQEGGRLSTATPTYYGITLHENPSSLNWHLTITGGLILLLTLMRLCSGRLQAAMWSCRSCCEKFWCIWAASWASMVFPQALFKSAGEECSEEDYTFDDIGSILSFLENYLICLMCETTTCPPACLLNIVSV